MPDNKYIGHKIKSIRKSKGLTQSELADKIDKTESSVQKYENGITEVPMSVLEKIANALDVSLLVLMDIQQLGTLSEKLLAANNVDMAKLILDVAELQFDQKYSDDEKLLIYFDLLNNDGRSEALKRIEELTFIDKYVKTENDSD